MSAGTNMGTQSLAFVIRFRDAMGNPRFRCGRCVEKVAFTARWYAFRFQAERDMQEGDEVVVYDTVNAVITGDQLSPIGSRA